MKTIMLIIALAGFSAAGGYAQNKDCCCTHKTAHHKTANANHKMAATASKRTPVNKADEYMPATVSSVARLNLAEQRTQNATAACYTYRKHNIVVTECPGIMYDDAGDIQYSTEGTYLGYYPLDPPKTDDARKNVNEMKGPIAPQHNVICNKAVVAPADGNYSTPDCLPQ